jgi:quercetin dioxygenase-like cupin family protein
MAATALGLGGLLACQRTDGKGTSPPVQRTEKRKSGNAKNAILPERRKTDKTIANSIMNPISISSDGGRKVNILGIPMLIRIHGRDTGGVVSVVESHDVPGGGPPPHIHQREDETFQILEGEYEWMVGDKKFIAQTGATIFAPRGIPHTYRYLGQTPGRLMCVITPSGFEGFFEEIGALSPQEQQDIPCVIEIGKKYGLEILPPTKT